MHNTEQTDLATLVYHELRAPLGLLATVARMASEEQDAAAMRRQCEVIERTAQRMLRITRAVVQAAQAAQDQGSQLFDPADVAATLVRDLEGDAPVLLSPCPGVGKSLLQGSIAQFEALLHSLIVNALDHHEPGTPVVVSTRMEGDHFRVDVQNIPARKDRHRGAGLGLMVCQQLVDRLGARMDVEKTGECYRAVVRMRWAPASQIEDVPLPAYSS